ncbi:hypothetical protein [Streptomyces sp. NBC_01481]|uniref:hypothetical protein n=1 Tax=Streptomyces sp. NBC_01481 TaxID=2975869 RepID=UPI002251112D|nr:hypothetical protein [Streptomyces sp. NBC_01481]MCX4587467.1 hypothetical protein [Streptomyces sp. NBC_01481]
MNPEQARTEGSTHEADEPREVDQLVTAVMERISRRLHIEEGTGPQEAGGPEGAEQPELEAVEVITDERGVPTGLKITDASGNVSEITADDSLTGALDTGRYKVAEGSEANQTETTSTRS